MPPQSLNLTSTNTLAGAYRDASLAALRAAFVETNAPAAQSAPNWLTGLRLAFRKWRQRAKLRASLREVSDSALMDIGLTPGDIAGIFPDRAIEKLRSGTTYFWTSRGVM